MEPSGLTKTLVFVDEILFVNKRAAMNYQYAVNIGSGQGPPKDPRWFFKPSRIKPLRPTASGARQAIGRRLERNANRHWDHPPGGRQLARSPIRPARACPMR
jgi:hypothetical protein